MTKSGIFLFILFTSFLFTGANAEVPDFHKPIPCIGCHQETLGADIGPGECGNCHNYKLPEGGINIPLMEQQHNPGICTACHIGNTEIDASERDTFHNAHNTVQCIQCHVSNNSGSNRSAPTIVGIEEGRAFQCTSCHGNQIHGIHMANLSRGCPICHGSWAENKVYKADNSLSSRDKIQDAHDLSRFTIFSLIKALFSALIGAR